MNVIDAGGKRLSISPALTVSGLGFDARHQELGAAEEPIQKMQHGLFWSRGTQEIGHHENKGEIQHQEQDYVRHRGETVNLVILDLQHVQDRHAAKKTRHTCEEVTDQIHEEEKQRPQSEETGQLRHDEYIDPQAEPRDRHWRYHPTCPQGWNKGDERAMVPVSWNQPECPGGSKYIQMINPTPVVAVTKAALRKWS